MSFIINPYRFVTVGGKTWAFHNSTNSNTNTISGPASGCQVGDLAVLFDASFNSIAITPAEVVPAGYTLISSTSVNPGIGTACRSVLSYKILASGDLTGGAMNSVTGMDSVTDRKIMAVFRDSNGPLSSVTINSLQAEGVSGTPSGQTIPLTGETDPALALVSYRTETTPGFTGTGMTDMLGNTTVHLTKYRLFNTGQTNQAVSMTDGGAGNILQSFYVT